MNIQEFLIQVFSIFLGVFLAGGVLWLLIASFIKENRRSNAAQDGGNNLSIMHLKLQAYERIIIFVDRINPINILLRVQPQSNNVQELNALILSEIRQEYQHNVAQQIYISKTGWEVIRKLKDDTISMMNNVIQSMPVDATPHAVSIQVIQKMASLSENPYELSIELLKAEIYPEI